MADEQQLLGLIVGSNQGVLAAVTLAGYPHLTNVLYVWDPQERIARVSTTADRVKARILGRDPRAALHVSGPHFWSYAVAECDAEISDVAAVPGDEGDARAPQGPFRLLRRAGRAGCVEAADR